MPIQPVVVGKVSVFKNEMDYKYIQRQICSAENDWCEAISTLFVG